MKLPELKVVQVDTHEANLWLEMGSPESFSKVKPEDLHVALGYFLRGLTSHIEAADIIKQLRAENEALKQQVEQGKRDAERWNWWKKEGKAYTMRDDDNNLVICSIPITLSGSGKLTTVQEAIDAMIAAAPQPEPVDADLRRDAELWRAHQKRKQLSVVKDCDDRYFAYDLSSEKIGPQVCIAEIVTIDAAMLSQGEQK